MKKFLSVMLAVMMVLSTVSFAAPSAVGTLDTVTESEVDFSDLVFEDAAELAATAGDESTYGKLILNVDFENFEVGEVLADYTWFENILDADDYDPEFVNQSFRPNWEVGANTIAELNGNKYIRGGQGWSQIRMENQKYGIGEGQSPEGVYTFALDAIDFGDTARKVSATTQSSWVGGVQVTAPVTPTTLVSWSGKLGEWERVAAAWNGSTNNMSWYFTDGATTEVGFDNIKVYYRPATVTLTIAGEEYEVSTDAPVTVSSLASKVAAPTGYILSGLSLEEGGELIADQYFFEDATLYPVFVKDPYMSETYGKALFVVDFETEAAQTWWGHSEYDNSTCSYGAQAWRVASYYDARFDNANFRIRFITNEGEHGNQGVAVDAEGNHYNKGTTLVQWPNLSLSNWGNVMGEPGIYTYVFKRMVSGASSVSSSSPAGYDIIDGYCGEQGVWDTIVVQKQLDAEGLIPDGNIQNFSLAAADKGVAEIAYDDLYLYYKPFSADVTLVVNGEEYVAEDVSTAGVSADTIVAAAGVEIPYGKKPVLSATQGGESAGNVITLAGDAKYYVSFVADDSISEYGKRLFLIDFEQFEEGTAFTPSNGKDIKEISTYTDNYNGDWSHLTINWEAGNDNGNVIVEEDGNKFIKGQQGWAQIRIGNANYESAPDGYYTMALKTKNYGYPTETKSIAIVDQSKVFATSNIQATVVDAFVDNGEWDTVAGVWDYSSKDYTIHYTAQMSTDIAFDDIALYYRPASVNLTVVDADGNETVYENADSVVNVDELLADINAPFGYKAALSTEKNGEPITGTLNLVADAKLYVVLTEDETVHFEYGKALYIIDFERESMQGWNGNSQEIDNSVKANGAYVSESASYYDPMFEGKNYRVRFVINENDDWLFDQKTVADANGNHYNTGTIKTQWPQVYQTNYGSLTGKAGYYTYMVDTYTTEANAVGFGAWTNLSGFTTVSANEWVTVIGQQELTAEGNLPAGQWFNYSYGADKVGNVTVSFDNARLYYKPYTASIDVVANGEVVKTVESVDTTAGILASELVAGVKVKGFEITGVKLGTVAYGLDETVVPSCDCSVDLVLVERTADPATPETAAEKSIRISDPTGIRFKAGISKAEIASVTDYGWVVVRQKHLNDAGITAASVTVDGNEIKKVVGYGRQNNEDLKSFFEQDAEYSFFTAVLYFSATEDDGYPTAEKLAEKFVAIPFAKVDGEFIYGDDTAPTSLYDVALALWESDEWKSLDEADQTYLDNLMIKVDEAGLGA